MDPPAKSAHRWPPREKLAWSSAAALLPPAAVAAVVVLVTVVGKHLGLTELGLRGEARTLAGPLVEPGSSLEAAAVHMEARLAWAVAVLFLAVAAVLVLGLATVRLGRWLYRWHREASPRQRWTVATVAVAATLAFAFVLLGVADGFLPEPYITRQLRDLTLRGGAEGTEEEPREGSIAASEQTARTEPAAGDTAESSLLEGAIELEDAVVDLSLWALLPLLAACSAALLVPLGAPRPEREWRRFLEDRLRGVRHLLYAGAFLLVFDVLENNAFYRWPAAWLDGEAAAAVDRMAQAVSAARGAAFSLFLLVLYLPTASILYLRLGSLPAPERASSAPEVRSRPTSRLNLESLVPELSSFLAVVAPFLASGPVGAIWDMVGG